MKNAFLLTVLLSALAAGYVPGPERYEAKSQLPGLRPPALPAESSHSYDVRHYRIDMDLPMTDGSMTARCAIRLISNVPALDSIYLNFANLTCDSVKLGDRQLEFQDSWLFLNVYLDPPVAQGDSVTIDIFYRRAAGTSNRGFFWYARDPGQQRLHSVAYSITQPNDARYWFPCWDHPWDKAEAGCMVNITVPDSFTACAPGLLDSVTGRDGKRTFWWTHRYPVATYLVNFAASIFTRWDQQAHIGGGDSIPIYNYIWPEDSAASAVAFRNVPDMVEFYSAPDRFERYPFSSEKYGHVSVFPLSFGGMEHQTMTTVHRWWVLNAVEWGIAHELAHMWFGDYVTCRDWREIWLNEGSATYLDPLWFHHFYGPDDFHQTMADYAAAYFESDARSRRPLYDPPLSQLFDWGHTYCKSAWVNHMTRYLFRDTVFDQPGLWFEAERAYLDSFAYGTATTEGRRLVHERVTGLDLEWFYDEWVFQAGFPNYTVNWFAREADAGRGAGLKSKAKSQKPKAKATEEDRGAGWELVLDIGQNNGARAPEFFRTPVEVQVNLAGGRDTLLYIEIHANPQREILPLSAEPVGILFDPGRWLLHKVRITSGVEDALAPEVGVSRPVLHPAAPSPARDRSVLRFSLPNAQPARLTVHDATGRLVRTLAAGRLPAGHHDRAWDLRDEAGRRVAAGAYLVRFAAGPVTQTGKLVVR